MTQSGNSKSSVGLEKHGLKPTGNVFWNLGRAELIEHAVKNGDGKLSKDGALVSLTGQHTGRSPNDKFIVREPSSEKHVHWGNVNKAIDEAKFDALHADMVAYLADKELYVLDAWAGADAAYRSRE
mgnify:CR=1 FL=1